MRNTYIAPNATRLAQSTYSQVKARMNIRISTWNMHTLDDPTPTAKRRQTCTHPGTISTTQTCNAWTMDTSHDCKSNTKSVIIINVGETSERRGGGAHMDFSERLDSILNWTELCCSCKELWPVSCSHWLQWHCLRRATGEDRAPERALEVGVLTVTDVTLSPTEWFCIQMGNGVSHFNAWRLNVREWELVSNTTLSPPEWFCIQMSNGVIQFHVKRLRGAGGGGGGAYLTLTLLCHHQNDYALRWAVEWAILMFNDQV